MLLIRLGILRPEGDNLEGINGSHKGLAAYWANSRPRDHP